MKHPSLDGLQNLKLRLYRAGRITPDIRRRFHERYGERFERAVGAVAEGSVFKYVFHPSGRVVWVVVGRERDYLIESDDFCACYDFYLNSVVRGRVDACYHILAKVLAEFLGMYRTVKVEDEAYSSLMEEWRSVYA